MPTWAQKVAQTRLVGAKRYHIKQRLSPPQQSSGITMKSTANRKRKSSSFSGSSNTGGVELPRIPHIPVDLVPQFLQTLKMTTKFFQKHTSETYTVVDWEKQNNHSSSAMDNLVSHPNGNLASSSQDVHSSLMNRMDSAAAGAGADQATDEAAERELNMKKAVHNWMEDVKRFARRKQQQPLVGSEGDAAAPIATNNTAEVVKERPSVPYAFFLYLWGIQQTHDRVAVRRSTQFLSGLLLQKSKDSRRHLEQEAQLSQWVSNIMGKGVIWRKPDCAIKELPLLHREAFANLSWLLSNGYGTMYPKIGVAAKSLRHQCPNIEATQVSTTTSMPEFRRLRDIALRYGEEEISRVERLVEKANACLVILVPRVGVTDASESVPDTATEQLDDKETDKPEAKDDSSDDESDIEWEDGDTPDEVGLSLAGSHLSAVEQTIAAMEASGATLFRGRELEIDFDRPQEQSSDPQNSTDQDKTADVRKKLEKYTVKLSNRHLNRLKLWLDGLQNADNLILQPDSSSLVTLSAESSKLRLFLVQQLTTSKDQVSRVLFSASRLSIEANKPNTESAAPEARHPNIGLRLGGDNSRLRAILRQKKRKSSSSHRSTRIRIKCKSR
ncbi:MAG: hypothetical protein SGILL_000419 [Bacillariaceae sp.]